MPMGNQHAGQLTMNYSTKPWRLAAGLPLDPRPRYIAIVTIVGSIPNGSKALLVDSNKACTTQDF